jgi:hypothetical protein
MSISVQNISLHSQTHFRVNVKVDQHLEFNVDVPRGNKPIEQWTIGEIGEAARVEAAKRLPTK